MKRPWEPMLAMLLLVFGACSEKVEVSVSGGRMDPLDQIHVAYGVETVRVWCRPSREVTYAQLLADGALAGADTYPGPVSAFAWDVSGLVEGSMHTLRGRAIAGSREYLSEDFPIRVGYLSRLIVDDEDDSFCIYRPDGLYQAVFEPMVHEIPSLPRLARGCHEVVFLVHHKLYSLDLYQSGAKPRSLDSLPNGIFSFDASPVSDLVVYEGFPAGTGHLFTVDSMHNRSQLTHDSDVAVIDSSRFIARENSHPEFSPDGNRVAYFRKSECVVPGDPHRWEYREDAFVMNRDGSNPENLTAGVDNADFSSFTWTFDGKWVLFRVGNGYNPRGVAAANMRGHTITGLFIPSVAIACSPLDSHLVYVEPNFDRRLYLKGLSWTDDTIYADTGALELGLDAHAHRDHVDWVRYTW